MTTDAVGGVWTFTTDLAQKLQERGMEVLLAVLGPAPDLITGKKGKLRIVHHEGRLEWMDDPWNDVAAEGDWLMDMRDEFRPDVVHLNGYAHASLPWEVPVVVTAHSCVAGWWSAVKSARIPPRYAEYVHRVREGLAAADLVVAPTAAMRESLRREYGFNGNVAIVANGIERSQFRPLHKQSVILTSGRGWDEAKNIRLLDSIAGQLELPVYFAGQGEFAHLHPLGQLPRHELASTMGLSRIYAAPAFYEPFGLAILEAAFSGCALVLADIPSLRELWNGAALFASPHDPEEWTRILNQLAGSVSEWGALARQRAGRFSLDRMSDDYWNIYQALCRKEVAA